MRPTFNAITGTSASAAEASAARNASGTPDRLDQQRDHVRGRFGERVRHVVGDIGDQLLPGRDDHVEADAAIVERQGRERRPGMADERHGPAPDVVGRGEPGRTQVGVEAEEPHAVAAAHRDSGVARDGRDALGERRHPGSRRLGLVERRERNGGSRPGRDRVAQRLLDPMVRDAEDRQVDGPGDVGDRRIAPMSQDVVVAGVHRIDRAVEASAEELEHHLPPERALLDAGTDDGDRTRLEHALERGPFVGFAAGCRHPLLVT